MRSRACSRKESTNAPASASRSSSFVISIELPGSRSTIFVRAAEVDEVVQDAFLKAFTHLPSFREELLFELWFTKILVNACLDRIKSRNRRARWLLPSPSDEFDLIERHPSSAPSPENVSSGRGSATPDYAPRSTRFRPDSAQWSCSASLKDTRPVISVRFLV